MGQSVFYYVEDAQCFVFDDESFSKLQSHLFTLTCFPHNQKFTAVVPFEFMSSVLCLDVFESLCQQEFVATTTTRGHY